MDEALLVCVPETKADRAQDHDCETLAVGTKSAPRQQVLKVSFRDGHGEPRPVISSVKNRHYVPVVEEALNFDLSSHPLSGERHFLGALVGYEGSARVASLGPPNLRIAALAEKLQELVFAASRSTFTQR